MNPQEPLDNQGQGRQHSYSQHDAKQLEGDAYSLVKLQKPSDPGHPMHTGVMMTAQEASQKRKDSHWNQLYVRARPLWVASYLILLQSHVCY